MMVEQVQAGAARASAAGSGQQSTDKRKTAVVLTTLAVTAGAEAMGARRPRKDMTTGITVNTGITGTDLAATGRRESEKCRQVTTTVGCSLLAQYQGNLET